MKLSLNLFVALYLASWLVGVAMFNNFVLINISFLLVSIVAILLFYAFKRKKIFEGN